jgi:hypothetical protein
MLAFSVCRARFGVHVSRHRHAGAADLPSKCQSLRQHLPLAGGAPSQVTIQIFAVHGDDDMAKIESIRFNGRTTSEVRKQYRQWYEDNRAKISFVDEHEIERLRLETGGPHIGQQLGH